MAILTMLISGFLASTLLPGGSELVLVGLLATHPEQQWALVGAATLGNTVGGLTSYGIGAILPGHGSRHVGWMQQYGAGLLLLAWMPIVGDGLCVAAGWLKIGWLRTALWSGVGRLVRYALLAAGLIHLQGGA